MNWVIINTFRQDKMAAIFQMTFSNVFSWMFELTVIQHWFWQWFGTGQATSHYLNQWWPSIQMHICVTWRPQWVNINWAIKNQPEKNLIKIILSLKCIKNVCKTSAILFSLQYVNTIHKFLGYNSSRAIELMATCGKLYGGDGDKNVGTW